MDNSSFEDILPAPVRALLFEYVLRPDAPLPVHARAVAGHVHAAAQAVAPHASKAAQAAATMATPFVDRAAQALYNAPDVLVLAAAILLVYFVLQLLSFLRRLLAWWTRLAFRLLFWSVVVLLFAAVYQRGLQQSAEDAAAIVGRLMGYASAVRDIWQAEYQRYAQQQAQAAAFQQQQQQHKNYNSNNGYNHYNGGYRPRGR